MYYKSVIKQVLRVRTEAQKALLVLEYLGQFSDGRWENSSLPEGAWEQWSDAETVVARPGEALGRNFAAIKDNWELADKELLDVVGDRMLQYARVAKVYGFAVAKKFEEGHGLDGHQGTPGQYEEIVALNEKVMTKKEMMEEIRDLKKIMKTFRQPEEHEKNAAWS